MNNSILEVINLTKTYRSGNQQLTVLDQVNLRVESKSSCSIVGSSGSGKTTLLGLCAGLDRADYGSVKLNKMELDHLSEDKRALIRNQYVGFVFQTFNLMPTLTALENVMVPLELRKEKNIRSRAIELLKKVGLGNRFNHYPSQLSGGEQQRVSIARAFSNQPKILFADEPTGNLDEETGSKIEDLLFDLNRELGTTLVLVTHDLELAQKTDQIYQMKGGQLFSSTSASSTSQSN